MYLLRNNKLISIDISEDNYREIKAIKTIDVKSTLVITKQDNNMTTEITQIYHLHNELDGYIFRNAINNLELGGHHTTIGDAIKSALYLRFKVYNNGIEITKPE